MHETRLIDSPASAVAAPARAARLGLAADLAAALMASRADTLATFAAYEAALPGLVVPRGAELNPPLWELGHIGWFQSHWLARFPARHLGTRADPEGPRQAAPRANADALYNSSLVPHDTRWSLPLPDATATRADLQAQLQASLDLLQQVDDQAASTDDALYFFRLALLHEDMHHEAALYMAQALGVAITDPRWQATALPEPPAALRIAPGRWALGSPLDAGFSFDNELGRHEVVLPATHIDAQVLRWADYLPFVEEGGHGDERCWSAAGWRWRQQQPCDAPRYLRQQDGIWQHRRHGQWQRLDVRSPACHLSWFEAEAWCRWAGRRLPTEAEWERAACCSGTGFRWGDVWEWTASPFAPYPGFVAHPYRDYSAPWFDGRPVLRGASFLTQPRMRHPRYRNFFPPHRNDVPAGFRTCAR
jgi:ergothioneine biosynthesis protein EgtB